MGKVHISAVRSDDKTTETWVLHVYAPAPHHAEWLAYTPVHVGRFDVPSYRGSVTVEAGNLDRAKRHAIAYFKAIEPPAPRDGAAKGDNEGGPRG